MKTPWEQGQKRRYQEQEERTAKKDGARKQLNSGRVWSGLRDVVQETPIGKLLYDNKDTEAASFTIKLDDFEDFKRDANRTPPGCHPVWQIDIQNLRLVTMEETVFDDALKYIAMLEAKLGITDGRG